MSALGARTPFVRLWRTEIRADVAVTLWPDADLVDVRDCDGIVMVRAPGA